MNFFKKPDIEYRLWESKEWQSFFDEAELRLSKEGVYTLIQFMNHALLSVDGDVIDMGVYKCCTSYCIGHFINEFAQNGGVIPYIYATHLQGHRTIMINPMEISIALGNMRILPCNMLRRR